jgi:hypothetical protein
MLIIVINWKKCTELFKEMEILHFFAQELFSLLLYVLNKHLFLKHSAVHNDDFSSTNNLHLPFTNSIKYQKVFIIYIADCYV